MKWLKSGVFLLVVWTAANAAPTKDVEWTSLRLPKTSIPYLYDLALNTAVHTGQRAFSGTVKISIAILEPTNYITLHNRQLDIDFSSITLKNTLTDVEYDVTVSNDEEREFIHIESATPLQEMELFTLEISFAGLLQLGTSGFYRSSYRLDGETRYLNSSIKFI